MTMLRSDESPDLALVLAHGPFAEALRTVLRVRGMTLDSARRGLRRRGIEVSLASLSHWQSGQHLPRPDTWARLGPALDDLLALEPGTVRELLEKARIPVDSRRALLVHADPAYSLMRDIGAGDETFWSPLSVRQHAEVSAQGYLTLLGGTTLRRAAVPGDEICLVYVALDGRAPAQWSSRSHAVRRVATHDSDGSSAAILAMDAPVERDDIVLVESTVRWADGPTAYSTEPPQNVVGHCVGPSCRDWNLIVEFSPERLPHRIWLTWSPTPFGQCDQVTLRELTASKLGIVQATVLDPRPGTYSIHWDL